MLFKLIISLAIFGLVCSTCVYDQNKYDGSKDWNGDGMQCPNPPNDLSCWSTSLLFQPGQKCNGNYRWYADLGPDRTICGVPPCVSGYYCKTQNAGTGSVTGYCAKKGQ